MGSSIWSGIKGVVTTPVNDVRTKGARGYITVRFPRFPNRRAR